MAPIVNPYAAGAEKRRKDEQKRKEGSANNVLMAGARHLARQKRDVQERTAAKRRVAVAKDPPTTPTRHPSTVGKRDNNSQPTLSPKKPPAKRSAASVVMKTVRRNTSKAGNDVEAEKIDGEPDDEAARTSGWSKRTLDFLQSFAQSFTKTVGFNQRGLHEMFGAWPAIHYQATVCPSHDPIQWSAVFQRLRLESGTSSDDDHPEVNLNAPFLNVPYLEKSDFAVPDVMIWGPELRWPHLYPEGRPCCKWHNGTACVVRKGISHHPRRCYDVGGNTALFGYRYVCKTRQMNKEKPASFFSYDSVVIGKSNAFVQSYWREHGYKLTARAAISWKLIEEGRSLLVNGAGASGFQKAIAERYKIVHWNRKKGWRGYVTTSYTVHLNRKSREVFYNFEDAESELHIPSLKYLIQQILSAINSRAGYCTLKMQTNLGVCLSADHSHKIAKVVLLHGDRAFEGLYTVMNEVGKILGFWFVSGTTLAEVEEMLRGINRRYQLHGVAPPQIFTTDRCCQERSSISGSNNAAGKPIFDSLAPPAETVATANTESDISGDHAGEATQPIPLEDLPVTNNEVIQPTVDANRKDPADEASGSEEGGGESVICIPAETPPTVVDSEEIADVIVGHIVNDCNENEWDTIGLDSEWKADGLSRDQRMARDRLGPDILQLGLPNGRTVVFMLRLIGMPLSLKNLLESETLFKVANRISADSSRLSEIGVTLKGRIELGQVAKKRGIVERGNASLDKIVYGLFGCNVQKDATRRSDWSIPKLTTEQIEYAATDAYAHIMSYRKLMTMPYIDANAVESPKMAELEQGCPVLLYTSNMSMVVASAEVVGPHTYTPSGPFSHVTITDKKSVSVRLSQEGIRVPMATATTNFNGSSESFGSLFSDEGGGEPGIGTVETVEIPWKLSRLRIDTTNQMKPHEEVVVGTRPVVTETNDPDAPQTSNFDEERQTKVKNDILHIFLRFSTVLSKKHGLFKTFMSRLADCFYHPSQEDLEQIKQALKQCGFTDDEIRKKQWQYYKGRVRRTVPPPEKLEEDFETVCLLFANIPDTKTKLPLFNEKVWTLYKNVLGHIRKNCLSDEPDTAYYIRIGEDRLGIPLYKCVRGTSALEGFHQKIRQLIRGFNISPYFAVTLLLEFVHRWNHEIDVNILGLPTEYSNFYDLWEIDEEIEDVATWDDVRAKPHEHLASLHDIIGNGTSETFGLVGSDSFQSKTDEEIEHESQKVADAYDDGTMDPDDENEEHLAENFMCATQNITESEAWLSARLGCPPDRCPSGVVTEAEIEFFKNNYQKFMNGEDTAADSFSAINFSELARHFNDRVTAEVAGFAETTDISFKTAYHLQQYWKKFKQESNTATTLLPIQDRNKEIRREWRGTERSLIPDAVPANRYAAGISMQAKVVAENPIDTGFDSGTEIVGDVDDDVFVELDDIDLGTDNVGDIDKDVFVESEDIQQLEPSTTKPKKPRRARRCRKCGNPFNQKSGFAQYHQGLRFGNTGQVRPHEVCKVPEELWVKGHTPLEDGARFNPPST